MDVEKNVQLLSSIWPVILSLLAVLAGYISLQFRVKRLEERNKERDDADREKIDKLSKIGDDIAGIKQSQAVIAAEMKYLTRPAEHR